MKEKIGGVIISLGLGKIPHKSGKYPVYIRVQNKNENRHYSCHTEMSKEEWNRFDRFPKNDHPAMLEYQKFKNATLALLRKDAFSFSTLSSVMARGHGDSIQSFLEYKRDSFKDEKKFNTANLYNATLVSLNAFLRTDNVPVGKIIQETCKEFMYWLENTLANSSTTIAIKLRCLHAALEEAKKQGVIIINPLDGVKKPAAKRRNLAISKETLKKLLTATPEQIGENHYFWLCFWRCIYYGNGLNVKDLLKLKYSDVDMRNNVITFIRSKTMESSGRQVTIALLPELAESLKAIAQGKRNIIPILDNIRQGSKEEYVTIRNTTSNINKHLRKICKILEIPEHITTGTGRHAFATTLLQNEVPIEYISAALGHASIKTTQNYLDGYTNQQITKYANVLTKDIKQQETKTN